MRVRVCVILFFILLFFFLRTARWTNLVLHNSLTHTNTFSASRLINNHYSVVEEKNDVKGKNTEQEIGN